MNTTKNNPSTKTQKSPNKWLLRLTSLIWGIAFFPAIFISMMSVMIFDSPGSETSLLTVIFALSTMTAPLVLLVASIGCFRLSFSKKLSQKNSAAKIYMLLPFLNIVLFVTTFALLEMFCNGEFSC